MTTSPMNRLRPFLRKAYFLASRAFSLVRLSKAAGRWSSRLRKRFLNLTSRPTDFKIGETSEGG